MKKHPFIYFFRGLSLVLLLVAVAMLSAIATMHFAIHGAEVQVPDLKGLTVAAARSQAAGMGLNLDVDNRYYSAEVAAGHILSQSPDPGTVVRREWRVRVAESLGPQKVDVPDTVGSNGRLAALRLRRVGLEVGIIARLPFAGAPEGTVIAQNPPAHAQGIEQPSVNLLVAVPEDETPDGFVMPNLVGMPIVAAQALLAKVGLTFSTPVFVDVPPPSAGDGNAPANPPVSPGSVVTQDPIAGARVDTTQDIKLTVAK